MLGNANVDMKGCVATEASDGSVCAQVHWFHFEDAAALAAVRQRKG